MKRLSSFCALFTVIFLNFAPAEGTDWILLGKNSKGAAHYDRAGIERTSKEVVRVPVKLVYSAKGVREFRDAFPKTALPEGVGYTLYLYEINCPSNSFRLIKAATFSTKGSVIEGTELDYIKTGQSARAHITPNSIVEKLSEAACNWAQFKH